MPPNTALLSRRHLLFLNQLFRNPSSQSFCQDVELRCFDGSLLFNKLIVGLVYPQLKNSLEYQLSLSEALIMPDFSMGEVVDKFNNYFSNNDIDENGRSCTKGEDLSSYETAGTVEEVITELVVEEADEKQIYWLQKERTVRPKVDEIQENNE